MPFAGFEPHTLGAASSNGNPYTMLLPIRSIILWMKIVCWPRILVYTVLLKHCVVKHEHANIG